MNVPAIRIRVLNRHPVRAGGRYVLYWMIANRRLGWNFALQHAQARAHELGLPLLVFEPLGAGHRWASERVHRFVMDGMAEHCRALRGSGIGYFPWVEPRAGVGRDLLATLARRAAVVVTDDAPAFLYPKVLAAAASRLDVVLEAVDSNGLLPLRATDRAFGRAHAFRRFLQKSLPEWLDAFPHHEPIGATSLPRFDPEVALFDVVGFAPTSLAALEDPTALARLPIDHGVSPLSLAGGTIAARRRLQEFLTDGLESYGRGRNHPDDDRTSHLSPYLHFGHISSHEAWAAVAAQELWTPSNLAIGASGARRGWWGMSAGAEAFLDQLVTWRELALNTAAHRDDYDRYQSLPGWALETLEAHRRDERTHLYGREALEAAATHDELWNAAQTQLVREGRIHGYLRMLWGKKVLEWSPSPQAALDAMIELNNKYALDGRDANSYAGIFWILGRYDRPWGPERPIFGRVRYMSSESAARKLRLRGYLRAYGSGAACRQKAIAC